MAITQILARAPVIPATMQRSRARVAAIITVLCLAAGCENPLEKFEPDEQTRRDLEKCGETPSDKQLAAPPGSYIDHGLALDYARLQRDGKYIKKVLHDPRMFEQVYADAAGGHVTARWLVCTFEAGTRGAARDVAKELAGLRCQTIPTCSFPDKKLPYSGNFRHNLAQRTGGIPDKGQAHHVLPVKFEKEFRAAGINIHDPKFGAWWKAGDHQSVAKAYNGRWQRFFDDIQNPTSEQILQFGRKMAKDHGLEIGF